jgi:hypothetical protein
VTLPLLQFAALIQLSKLFSQLLVVIREGNIGAHGSGRSARFPNVFRTLASMIVYLLWYDYHVLFFKAFSMSNVHFNKRRDRPCPPSNGGGAVGGKLQAERFAAAAAAFAILPQGEPGASAKKRRRVDKSNAAALDSIPLIQFNEGLVTGAGLSDLTLERRWAGICPLSNLAV